MYGNHLTGWFLFFNRMVHECPALLLVLFGWHNPLDVPKSSNLFLFNPLRQMTHSQSLMWALLLNFVLSIFCQISSDDPHLWVGAFKPERHSTLRRASQTSAAVTPLLIYASPSRTSQRTTPPCMWATGCDFLITMNSPLKLGPNG